MNNNEILKQHIREQIALEEHLYKIISEQILEVESEEFSDAKEILIKTRETLENHFNPLNALLDELESQPLTKNQKALTNYQVDLETFYETEKNSRISRILRDDYSSLNLITMNNTLLHATALALDNESAANLSLKHMKNLAPLVVKIGELVPQVITRELTKTSPNISPSVASKALANPRSAWSDII